MSAEFETTVLTVKEIHLFQIPPRQTSRGYRATEWDVSQFLWSGRLRVSTKGHQCLIRFEDKETGVLFAQCVYEVGNNAVEQVTDSSRYFVVKVEDSATRRHAFLGMGFDDRNEAFDFNVSLQDFAKQLNRQNELLNKSSAPQPKVDYSLKEGASITINLSNVSTKQRGKTEEPQDSQPKPSTSSAPSSWVQF